MPENDELEQRHDIGIGLGPAAWLVIIAGGLVVVLSLCFGLKHFLEGEDPVTRYERQLELEEQQ